MESGKRDTSGKQNDWSIQHILCHDQPISTSLANNMLLTQFSPEPGQGCFSYVFDKISRIILNYHVNISAKCPTDNRVIILIQTVTDFFSCFEVDFQLVAGECRRRSP